MTPLVVALVRRRHASERPLSASRAFALGLTAGSVYFAGTLYWLVETMTTFGGLATPLATLAAVLLVAYLSLFPGVFALAVSRFARSFGTAAALLAVPAWVASELARQYVWDGFPWVLLGYSQVTWLPVAQLASVTGVYGLSALLAFTGAVTAYALVERQRTRWVACAAAGAVVVACVLWGSWRLADSALIEAGDSVRVAVVQANIAQEDKWNPALAGAITEAHLAMTREAIDRGARFVIWPESATPFHFENDLVAGGAIRRLARESGATLLIGSDQIEQMRAEEGRTRSAQRIYNAAFLVRPDGQIGGVYRKMHLVPFGEYVPARRLLFFVSPIVEAATDFSPGDAPVLLPVNGHLVSTAICYEVIFGNLIRQFVLNGSELLTTITNDAWYGRSSAAYQHWDQASLRAIEGGRYLARAANTGISGFVDPYGRVLQRSNLFENALLVEDLRFIRTRTIYSYIGDLVAWLALAATCAALLASRRAR